MVLHGYIPAKVSYG